MVLRIRVERRSAGVGIPSVDEVAPSAEEAVPSVEGKGEWEVGKGGTVLQV